MIDGEFMIDKLKLTEDEIKYVEALERKSKAIATYQKWLESLSTTTPKGEVKLAYYSMARELKRFLK